MDDKPIVFGNQPVRRIYDEKKEKWYFSVVDIIAVLIEQSNFQLARNYWKVLKKRLATEGSEVTNCNQLKLSASDGKMRLTDVADTEIRITTTENQDYLSLTDMIRAKDGDFFISDWLRNRNTVEFLGMWESINNPNFNYGEFATIKLDVGTNSLVITPQKWISKI